MSTPSYPFQTNTGSAPGGGYVGQNGSSFAPSNVTQSAFMTIPQAAPPGQAPPQQIDTMMSTGYGQSGMYPQASGTGGGMMQPPPQFGGSSYGMPAPTGAGFQQGPGMMGPGFVANAQGGLGGQPGAGMYPNAGGFGVGAPPGTPTYLEMPCPKCKAILQIAPHIPATYCVKCKVNHDLKQKCVVTCQNCQNLHRYTPTSNNVQCTCGFFNQVTQHAYDDGKKKGPGIGETIKNTFGALSNAFQKKEQPKAPQQKDEPAPVSEPQPFQAPAPNFPMQTNTAPAQGSTFPSFNQPVPQGSTYQPTQSSYPSFGVPPPAPQSTYPTMGGAGAPGYGQGYGGQAYGGAPAPMPYPQGQSSYPQAQGYNYQGMPGQPAGGMNPYAPR